MSPYKAEIDDFVRRFANSGDRIEIIRGFLNHRIALVAEGITGSQWLDGSFVENTEMIRKRSPRDIDVVTVARFPLRSQVLPEQLERLGALFDPDLVKESYLVDAYFIDLACDPQLLVDQTLYWSGLFGHQRGTNQWKGMVSVELYAPSNSKAQDALEEIIRERDDG